MITRLIMVLFCLPLGLLVAEDAAPIRIKHVKVEPLHDLVVKSKTSGNIDRLHAKDGVAVKKGDVIVSFDNRRQQIQVHQAESQLKVARHDLERLQRSLESRLKQADLSIEEAKRNLKLAQTEFNMQKDLRDKDMVSEMDYLLAESRWEASKVSLKLAEHQAELSRLNAPNDVAKAEERVRQLENSAELSRLALEDTTIRAPFDGVIQEVLVEPGELVSGGAPIVRVVNTRRLKLMVDVPVRYLERFTAGTWIGADIAFEGHGGLVKRAKIMSRTPIIDSASGTVGLRLELDNEKGSVLPGGLAMVTLVEEESDE